MRDDLTGVFGASQNGYVLEKFLYFVTHYDKTIIAVAACGVVLLVAIWIFLEAFVSKGGGAASDVDLSRIEASITKFIDRSEQIRATGGGVDNGGNGASAGAGGSSGSGDASGELAVLKKELEAKKVEVETLKSKTVDPAQDNTPQLLTKIKELEGRLAEYEIIEDDIADLSHYKEENERLKKQITASGGTVVATTAPSEAPAGAPAAPPAAVAAAAPVATPEVSPAPAAAATDPIVSDFSKAVDDLNAQVVEPAIPETPAEASAPAPTETPAAPAPVEAAATSGDVFSEFEQKGDANDPLAELGEIDTSRMLEELQGLDIDTSASADVLTETPDIDKMAAEAETLKGEKA